MTRWPLYLLILIVVLSAGDDTVRHALRFEREAILNGEVWRVLTCHLVHLGWMHTALNGAGLLLVAWLLPKGKAQYWLLFWVAASLFTSVGVWLDDSVWAYVGASGVLHGLLLLAAWFSRWLEPIRRYLMLVIIVGKLIWEQTPFYSDAQLAASIGGHVVVDAHLYGGLAGLIALLSITMWSRIQHGTPKSLED